MCTYSMSFDLHLWNRLFLNWSLQEVVLAVLYVEEKLFMFNNCEIMAKLCFHSQQPCQGCVVEQGQNNAILIRTCNTPFLARKWSLMTWCTQKERFNVQNLSSAKTNCRKLVKKDDIVLASYPSVSK